MKNSGFMDKFRDAYNATEKEENVFILPGTGQKVTLKPFKSGDQKEILKALEKEDLIKAENELDKVLRKCIVGVDPLKLLSVDRHALIVKLRSVSIGDAVTYSATCPNEKCGHTQEIKFSLDEFESSNSKNELADTIIPINEQMSFVLNHTTRKDEVDLAHYIRLSRGNNKNGKLKSEDVYSTDLRFATYAVTIQKVLFNAVGENGEVVSEEVVPTFNDKILMVSDISMQDSDKIATYIREQENFGYDMKKTVECPECGGVFVEKIEWIALFIR